MPSLYDRAALRCEQAILRVWSAWRQAHLTDEERPGFEAFRDECKAHLQELRDQIVDGQTPDIDRGWPDGIVRASASVDAPHGAAAGVESGPQPPNPEPVERIVEVENPETVARLQEAEARLAEAQEKLAAKKAGTDAPPADLLDIIVTHQTPAETHERLTRLYAECMQRAELARTRDGVFEGKSTTEWIRKAERYESGLKWNRGRMAEQV